MSLALATFRARYREFDQVPDAAVQPCLDEAENTVDRTVMDASASHPKGDAVVGLRAAAAIRRAMGTHAAGPAADYEGEASRLARGAASAYRVIRDG